MVGVGGLGLRVETASGRVSQAHVGEEVFLHTSLVVREDALTLFGFGTQAELEAFGFLTGVTGVGPRSALGVISALSPAEIARAVSSEDEKAFRKVSGIGPKTAKLIILSLAGKLAAVQWGDDEGNAPAGAPASTVADAVAEGLVGLGWGQSEAHEAVSDAIDAGVPDSASADLLRAALALLQAGRPGSRGNSGGAR